MQAIPKDGTIIKTAYGIDLDKLQNGFEISPITCYATSRNQAKQTLLQITKYDDYKLASTGEVYNYLTIPVKRMPNLDMVIFEGQATKASDIPHILNDRQRRAELNEILNNPAVQYCYIKKGPFYCPNWCGYTEYKHNAGVYLKHEAIQHAISVSEITVIPINIPEHNELINAQIKKLQSRLLPASTPLNS